jgi:hypothetical protein
MGSAIGSSRWTQTAAMPRTRSPLAGAASDYVPPPPGGRVILNTCSTSAYSS